MATLGTALEFPPDLPIPAELPTQSAERRVLSPEGGLFEVRVGQTDRKDYEEYVFPPYSPAQALALDTFWRVTLNKGGKWFFATWPRPEGWVATARKFVGPPSWEYIHTGKAEGGYWRVTGVFEVRGVGELPVEPDPPSAWNPDDKIALDLPPPLVLTENFRLATRATTATEYEAGVRGELSHANSGKWYFELEIVSLGDGAVDVVDNQDAQWGMVDDFMLNESFAPANSSSLPSIGAGFVLACNRYDGICWSSEPTHFATPGTFTTQPLEGDIYGFAWHVGTSVKVYRNGVLGFTAAFTNTGPMFPYFNAGSTNASGGDPGDSGESCRIRTGKRQFAYYPPAGYFPWG